MIRSFARKLSFPLVVLLSVLWLVLNQTLAPGQVLLGVLLAVLLAWAGSTLRPLQARLRRLDVAVVLAFVVLADVIRSNFSVARIVLGLTGQRRITAGFLEVPMDMRDPHGQAALAAIITCTPGAVWVGLSADGRRLRLHMLDLTDEDYWITLIKNRYEKRLMRIFE